MDEWSHLDSLHHSWSVYEEILESEVGPAQIDSTSRAGEASATPQVAAAARNKLKTAKTNARSARKSSNEVQSAEEGQSGAKKLDHNAKERIRRMKLNASYLALRALLPHSRRSKKKWSAPAIVDRVLKYIPELENEIEKLRSNKENVQSQAKANPSAIYQGPTISLNQVNQQEAIFQVCVGRQEQEESQLTHLLQSLESEGMFIKSASALDVSDTRICHHIHIQTNDTASEAANYFEELRDKLISWLT